MIHDYWDYDWDVKAYIENTELGTYSLMFYSDISILPSLHGIPVKTAKHEKEFFESISNNLPIELDYKNGNLIYQGKKIASVYKTIEDVIAQLYEYGYCCYFIADTFRRGTDGINAVIINIYYQHKDEQIKFYQTDYQYDYENNLKNTIIVQLPDINYYIKDEKQGAINHYKELELDDFISNRKPIKQINRVEGFSDIYNLDRVFHEDFNKWVHGEALRKDGKIGEAIDILEGAREHGYFYPEVYISLIKCYQSRGSYIALQNIIDLLQEAMENDLSGDEKLHKLYIYYWNKTAEKYIERKNRRNQISQVREIEKNKREQEKHEKREKEPLKGRSIIKLDDEGNTLQQYISIAEASRDTGVSSKCIRDAANGVQKHAGGYRWQYMNINEHTMDKNEKITY